MDPVMKSPPLAGPALRAALQKHQRWVDQHAHDWDARARFDAREPAPEKRRMAKARLRSGRR